MLIDSHCHLDRLDLSKHQLSLDHALDAARSKGVKGFLCISIGMGNASQVIDIANRYDDIYATAGIHPLEFNEATSPDIDGVAAWLESMLALPRVIAVGETGLDYYYSTEHREFQRESFIIHLQQAGRHTKPVIVHTRDARTDTLELIRQYGSTVSAGVMHCFTEDWVTAKAALDLGYYISFSGIITFKTAANLREVAAKVPIDRILVETDSPYLAPVPYRGRPNEPQYVTEVARCLAELRGISYESICELTGANFSRLFGVFR